MKRYFLHNAIAATFFLGLLLISFRGHAQEKNFIDQPYLETNARADTLVVPDRIYLGIVIKEEDTKGRTSVEELENRMAAKLKALGIDLDKQLMLSDLASNFRDYFLRKTDVQKSKAYTLVVYDAFTAGKVIRDLESVGISNINLEKTEYSKMESLKVSLRRLAVAKAREQAEAMVTSIGQSLGLALYISDLNTEYSNLQAKVYSYRETLRSADISSEPLNTSFEKIPAESMVNVKFAIGQ